MKRRTAVAGLLWAAALAVAPHGCARAPKPATPAGTPPAAQPAPAETSPPAPVEPLPPAPASSPSVPEPVAPAVASRPPVRLPERVRVGLATDLDAATIPCCDATASAEVGGALRADLAPIVVRPAARAVAAAVWRLQAAALRDEPAAVGLADRLAAHTGERASIGFDAAAGLYRVRLGGWPSREEAEAAQRRLRGRGLEGAWVVAEGGGLTDPALELSQGGRAFRVAGRRFRVRATGDAGLRFEGRRYRGTLEVYLNERGRLNVVNELGLEEYLRGVVPRELGPGQYGEIEALKAQAVAARSYTLRNLGGFSAEGFDLCARPQCQVYGGLDDEHPLSDRAVAETAGEVALHDGEPVDALYTATCGGHTEDVEVVFPLRTAAYLRGVPCVEAGGARVRGGSRASDPLAAALGERLPATAEAGRSASGLEGALAAIVRAAGVEPPPDRLRSLAPREVRRFLASQLDLAADARLFAPGDELARLVAAPPAGWSPGERRFAAWLAAGGLLDERRATPLGPGEARELAGRVAVLLRLVEERPAAFVVVAGDRLRVREGGAERELELGPDLATFHVRHGISEPGELLLLPGDAIRLLLESGRLAAVTRDEGRPAPALRRHERASWSRFKGDEELARLVRARYPGFELAGLEAVERGVSGRVGRLRLTDARGGSVDVEGLAVRWLLDLPDTLFTLRRTAPGEGAPGWRFTGRGWGHGVGMCQTGAYGMARRGWGYRDILGHYYRGVSIERLPAPAPDGVPSG